MPAWIYSRGFWQNLLEVLFPYRWLAMSTEGKDLTRAPGLYRTSAHSDPSDSDGEQADVVSAGQNSRLDRLGGPPRADRSQRAAGANDGVQRLGQTVVQHLSDGSVLKARTNANARTRRRAAR